MAKSKHILPYIVFLFLFSLILIFFLKAPADPGILRESAILDNVDFDYGSGARDATLSDVVVAGGRHDYKNLTITGTVTAASGPSVAIKIYASERIIIEDGGIIDASGRGLATSRTAALDGSGGSLGGRGGGGDCLSNEGETAEAVGDTEITFGDAGEKRLEADISSGGEGGGFILLSAPEIIIRGKIIADGNGGVDLIGGGSGGKIVLISEKIINEGTLSASGGKGANGNLQGYGGGGGGVIVLARKPTGGGQIRADGGEGGLAVDIYTGCNGTKGSPGKIFFGE